MISDSLILVNGDKLTGKIQNLSNNQISLKTNYAGTLEINWGMLDLLNSDKNLMWKLKRVDCTRVKFLKVKVNFR